MRDFKLFIIQRNFTTLPVTIGVIDIGSSVDISVAVATPNGLITPIVTGQVVKFR